MIKVNSIPEKDYEVLECLKKTENTGVYIAYHKKRKKKIVIKTLGKTGFEFEEKERRFKREAKILAKLEHPNIIRLLDFSSAGDEYILTFDYFEGFNLRQMMNKHDLDINQKLDLMVQLFEGLRYLHENQIIHRDLKPENILVGKDLRLKISDFGLALALDDDFTTHLNSIVGTPSYMSPEQIQGKRLDYSSDLFSAGTVMYEFLTRRNLFLGGDFNSTINNIINFSGELDNEILADLPPDVKTVLSRLLVKDPGSRICSSAEVLELLGRIPHTKAAPGGKKKYLTAAMVLLTLTLATFLLQLYLDREIPEQRIKTEDQVKQTVGGDSVSNFSQAGENVKNNEAAADLNDAPVIKSETGGSVPEEKAGTDYAGKSPPETEIASLNPRKGNLFIDTFPWAYVYINEEKIGTTPMGENLNLNAGVYEIKFVRPDFPAITRKIEVIPDSTVELVMNLEKSVSTLLFKVFPWGDVYIDDTYIGQTPFEEGYRILPGRYKLTIKNPNFPDYLSEIECAKDDTSMISYSFGR